MNPASDYIALSRMEDYLRRDVDASAIVGPEIYHEYEHPLYHADSNVLEDAVRSDNELAVQCSRFELSRAQFPKSVISLAGVDHIVLFGKDGKGVYAVPAFNEPLYLGETWQEVKTSVKHLRNATTFRQRDYSA